MAAPTAISRALVRLNASRQIPSRSLLRTTIALNTAATRFASSKSSTGNEKDGPRVLEKPDKFRPPSHGAKLPTRKRPSYQYGPRLTEEDLQAQKTKKYPNMEPPKGTWSYYLVKSVRFHSFIALFVLLSCMYWMWLKEFLVTTKRRDELPEKGELLTHPFQAIRQFWYVYRLHLADGTEHALEKRRKKSDDIDKRIEFRDEFGLEHPGSHLDKWTLGAEEYAKRDAEGRKQRLEERAKRDALKRELKEAEKQAERIAAGEEQEEVQQPKRKPKMWLGIW
ncbi:uncharacterized protein J3D65DRAFT_627935 [Phyllosticta citribraziliensis]|uniref:Uncharacterized protein n=1 Tax=Phyllosticta citribraziliensis TaxID=989973 RepID=A0ABR1LNE7_9PEZI